MTEILVDRNVIDSGAFARPDDSGAIPPSSHQELDTAVAELQSHKDRWVTLDLDQRIALLDQILDDLHEAGEEFVEANIRAKGTSGNRFGEAEEWAILSYIYRNMRLLGDSLRQIRRGSPPQIPGAIDKSPNGQVRARVFPVDRYDSLVFMGMTAEVWMPPSITPDDILDGQAQFYLGPERDGKVALVLGAGNVANLITADVLYKLFVEGSVVILKMNPVNAYLGPILARGFRALVEPGFLRIVYGGAEEGGYLCHHPDIDELHITGSDRTYEAIVFGPGDEGAKRKAQRRPLLEKPFSAELGNVTPVIVVPGPWSAKDIERWGEKLVSWLVVNAGFNCTTPRVIINWNGWQQRHDLNEAIEQTLARVETRKAYYPGARERLEAFIAANPGCQKHGADGDERLPWAFVRGVDPDDKDNICFRNEAFCGLFAETTLTAEDVPSFLETAVRFANERLWGNLSATLIVHPASLQDPLVAAAVEQAIADLRYGSILLNQYAPLGMFAMTTPWGAYPGNDPYDIQSGSGITCNTLMIDKPQKVVVRNPFKVSPDPLTLNSRTVCEICRQLAELQYRPSPLKMPGILWNTIRS